MRVESDIACRVQRTVNVQIAGVVDRDGAGAGLNYRAKVQGRRCVGERYRVAYIRSLESGDLIGAKQGNPVGAGSTQVVRPDNCGEVLEDNARGTAAEGDVSCSQDGGADAAAGIQIDTA